MTVPSERTQAVLRTRRFLMDLADPKVTPRIPLRLRRQALSLLKHLPTGADLSKAAQASPDTFGPVSKARVETARTVEVAGDAHADDLSPPKDKR